MHRAQFALTVILTAPLSAPLSAQWTQTESEWVTPQSSSSWLNFAHDTAVDGDTMAVSHSWQDDQVYIFEGGPGAWTETQLLTPPHGLVHSALRLALDGDVLLVGDAAHDVVLKGAGAAFVYERSGGVYTLRQVLEKPSPRQYDSFGSAVDVLGDWMAIGVPYDDEAGFAEAGAVYLYRLGPAGWDLVQKLHGDSYGDHLGSTIDLDGDRLVIGARETGAAPAGQGRVHVYREVGGVWILEQTIDPPVPQQWGSFGARLALDGERLAVASPFHDGSTLDTGRVDLFQFTGGTWQLTASLLPPAPTARCWFGYAVDLEGERLLVTQPGDRKYLHNNGAGYVFAPSGGTWVQLARLETLVPQDGCFLGSCGGLSDGHAYLGSNYDVPGGGKGSVMGFAYLGPDLGTISCVADPAGSDCPCAQPGGEDQGCANSSGRGASLLALGSASVTADDLRLVASGLPPYTQAGLFVGDAWAARLPLDDGLLCVGGAITRLPVVPTTREGLANFGPALGTLAPWAVGATFTLQVRYRDPWSACSGANLTPAVSLTITP